MENVDTTAEYTKAIKLMSDDTRINHKYFRKLFRMKPLVDIDLDGRRVMLRIHFRLQKSANA